MAGAAALVWVSLPLVWWTPLNVDEELTLRLADFSFGHIFDVVSTKRGGGPLHFWLEHALLGWWPGLGALRIPSLVFFLLALPAVALLVRRLLGDEASAGAVLLTALSPIPVLYATFGRPHTLLFAWLMWSTVLALKAADENDRRLWAGAGAALGLAVFVHPTAPLYALTAFAAAIVYAPQAPQRMIGEAWPGAVTLVGTSVPYYVRTLHVLGDRYGVSSGATRGRTYTGRPVWEDARHFVAPGGHNLNWFTILALVGVAALLVERRWRVVAFCLLTILTPVVFFSVVPANGDSALFFDRYMIPAIPAFTALVLAGCLALASWAGRYRLLVVVPLVAWLLVIELQHDLDHRNATKAIRVDAVVSAVAREPKGSILFGSTGTSGALFASFDYGHPANLLDHLVALRVRSATLVDDDSCERAEPFLAGPARPRYGVWLFYAASSDEAGAAARALGVAPVAGHYFVVRHGPAPPRALVRVGLRLRLAWKAAVPVNGRADELILADRSLLSGRCVPYGDLGDPDISPHWPPVETPHQ